MTMEWQPPQPGDLFDDRFRIDAVLGSGGFAYVYRAEQLDLGRTVALKILRPFHLLEAHHGPGGGGDSEFVRRFRREAQLVSRLTDPHTITMYEYGRTPDGVAYMSFEYVGGDNLDVVLRREGRLAPHRVVEILRQCLQSLQEAHHYSVLHRDIKPANIMLYERMGKPDHVKVLDFGIAKPVFDDAEFHLPIPQIEGVELTQAGAIVGTPRYMSPEQLRCEELSPASDLYSLGLVAYELLTGQKAIGGNTTMTIINAQLNPNPIIIPPGQGIPDGLRQIVNRMIDKELADRFQTAEEILPILVHWSENIGAGPPSVHSPTPIPPPSGPWPIPIAVTPRKAEAPVTIPTPALEPRTQKKPAGALPYVGVVAGAIVLVVIGVFALMNSEDPRQEALDFPATTAHSTSSSESSPPSTPSPREARSPHDLIVVTQPTGAALEINGKQVGRSPTSLELHVDDFPLDLVASLEDGRRIARTVAEPEELLTIEFPPLPGENQTDDEENTTIVTRPTPTPTQTARTATTSRRQTPRKTTTPSTPSRTSSKPEPKQDKKTTESSFPMLDGF